MKAIGTQTLQTERLILRRFVESDAEAMCAEIGRASCRERV